MIQSLFLMAQAAAPAAPATGDAAQQAPSGIASFLGSGPFMLVIFIIIFYVILIRPQRKAQKEHQARIQSLKKGDRVVTNAGIHGTIEFVGDTTVNVKIAEGTTIKLEKNSVSFVDNK